MGSSTQTPEEFDKEFIEKYDACIERAKNRCEEGMSEMACTNFATNRCETFLGTKDNPIIKSAIHFLASLLEIIQSTIPETTVMTLSAEKILINQ